MPRANRVRLAYGRRVGQAERDRLLDEAASIEAQRQLLAEQLRAKVREAVAGGATWRDVGQRLGVSASTALRRWGDDA